MNMQRKTLSLTGAILVVGLFISGVAQATLINSSVPSLRMDYHFFNFGGGNLSIAVDGITLADPEINLLFDDGSPIGALTGGFIANNDDGGGGLNSLLNVLLGLGDYVLAVGAFANTITETRTGIASTPLADGTYQAIYSPDVTVVAVRNSRDDIGFSTSIPEPTTLALLSLGLAGLGFTRRRMKA